jgi:hypothetical protein
LPSTHHEIRYRRIAALRKATPLTACPRRATQGTAALEDVLPKISHSALLLVLAVLPGASQAEAARLFAGYEIEWQGLPIGAFETELLTEAETYRVSYWARTTGFLGWLWPFSSEGSSQGSLAAMRPIPEYYEVTSRRRDENDRWAVRFGADGRAIQVDVPLEERLEREPVPPALQVAPDPLALALAAIGSAGPGAKLTGASFDGKRALRLEGACAEELVALAEAAPGAAAAAERGALACSVDGELAAGASRRWKGRSMRDDDRRPVSVWLGRGILEDAFWPVRVEAPTRYGTVTVRLVSLEPAADTASN